MKTNRLRRLEWLAATLLFAWLAIAYTSPLYRNLSSFTFYEPGDGVLNAYILRWDLHQLLHQPARLFDAPLLYPSPNTLALSENMLGLSLLLAPFNALCNETLLLGNLTIILSFFTLALTAFWVFRRWTGSFVLALCAATYTAFAAPRYEQLTHIQLLSSQPTLLAIYFFNRWLRGQRPRAAVGFWLSFVAQFLFGIYLFEFMLLVLFGLGAVLLPAYARRIQWRRLAAQAALGLCLCAVPIIPIHRHYAAMRRTLKLGFGYDQIGALNPTGASLTDMLHVSGLNRIYGLFSLRFQNTYSPVPWEHNVGPVYSLWPMLALAGCAALVLCRRRRPLPARLRLWLGLLAAAAVCGVLSLGPVAHWRGRPLALHTPFAFFYRHFPGFHGMRVPARLLLPLALLMPALVFVALAPCWRLLRRRRPRLARFAALALLGWALFEHRTKPLPLVPMPRRTALPPVIQALIQKPKAPVYFWASNLGTTCDAYYLLYQSYCWFPAINGFSGYMPPQQGKLLDFLAASFPSAQALDRLRALRVKYIVLAGHLQPDAARRAQLRAQLDALAAQGRLKCWFSDATDAAYTLRH